MESIEMISASSRSARSRASCVLPEPVGPVRTSAFVKGGITAPRDSTAILLASIHRIRGSLGFLLALGRRRRRGARPVIEGLAGGRIDRPGRQRLVPVEGLDRQTIDDVRMRRGEVLELRRIAWNVIKLHATLVGIQMQLPRTVADRQD